VPIELVVDDGVPFAHGSSRHYRMTRSSQTRDEDSKTVERHHLVANKAPSWERGGGPVEPPPSFGRMYTEPTRDWAVYNAGS
jgi:hypothetical protein